ncbi:hypothetical protein [Anabaena sp. UHCC 0451]|uniref:hypothetical protein n=1 Tax=Anabaena sp. UHCC 0451 TaxID=2055235 RepID=UPI002B207A6E|nr:hypothetical protein [Anabaena sp. UHCC 0451]MEA5577704.1 hypothetical protein [Anabaena sp. UHCC 0451]
MLRPYIADASSSRQGYAPTTPDSLILLQFAARHLLASKNHAKTQKDQHHH